MSDANDIIVSVEPGHHERAVLDAARALIIQNARFSHRFDLAKKWRSTRFQKVLADFGAVVCGFGALLAGLSVAIERTDTGELPWLRVGMLGVFVALFVLFQTIDWVMQWGYRRINQSLIERAEKSLQATGERLPATVSYELDGRAIRGTWRDEDGDELASWSHDLEDDTYLLAGEACFAGFDGPEKLSPSFCCYVDEPAAQALIDAFASRDVDVEEIDRELMVEADEQRPWPFDHDDA